MDSFWEIFFVIAVIVAILFPIHFISPRVKSYCVPIAISMAALIVDVILCAFIANELEVGSRAYALVPVFLVLQLPVVLRELRICKECGAFIGSSKEKYKLHRCKFSNHENLAEFQIEPEISFNTFVSQLQGLDSDISISHDPRLQVIRISRKAQSRLVVGVAFIMLLILALLFPKEETPEVGYYVLLLFISLGISLLFQSSHSEIDFSSRKLSRIHVLLGKFMIWSKSHRIRTDDYIEIRQEHNQYGKGGNYLQNVLLVNRGKKILCVKSFPITDDASGAPIEPFAKLLAQGLQIPLVTKID